MPRGGDADSLSVNSKRILLNSHPSSIWPASIRVMVEGKTVLNHGYISDDGGDSQVYFIDLKEELIPGTQIKIVFSE